MGHPLRALTTSIKSMRRLDKAGVMVLLALLVTAVCMRLVSFATLPGINGDEAWYGVQMQHLLDSGNAQWTTPPGNPLNPFHSGLVLLLLLVFEPAFWILRLPSLLAGIVGMFVLGHVAKKQFGLTTGVATLALAACTPAAIAYCRIGWDPSQDLLFGALAMHFAWTRRPVLMALLYTAAIWVHPTNVFLAGPLLGTSLGIWWRQSSLPRGWWYGPTAVALLGASSLLWTWLRVPHAALSAGGVAPELWDTLAARFFALRFIGVFGSGASTFKYLAGGVAWPSQVVLEIVFWCSMVPLFAWAARHWWKHQEMHKFGLLLGWVLAILVFALVAGPKRLTPGSERYLLFAVAPGIVVSALAFVDLANAVKWKKQVMVAGLLLCAALLLLTQQNLLAPHYNHTATPHRTFRSGAIEPKAQAAQEIRQRLLDTNGPSGGAPIKAVNKAVVIAQDWWLYWPLSFLLHTQARVVWPARGAAQKKQAEGILRRGGFIVTYAGSSLDRVGMALGTTVVERVPVGTYQGKPHLVVLAGNRTPRF